MPDGRTKEELVNQSSGAELSQDWSSLDSGLGSNSIMWLPCSGRDTATFPTVALGEMLPLLKQPAMETCKTQQAKSRFLSQGVGWEFIYFRAEFSLHIPSFTDKNFIPGEILTWILSSREIVTLQQERCLFNTGKPFPDTLSPACTNPAWRLFF